MSEDMICPFCGGTVQIKVTDSCGNNRQEEYEFRDHHSQGLYFRLVHDETNVPEGRTCPIATFDYEAEGNGLGTVLYNSREEAKKVWDTRYESSELPEWLRKKLIEDLQLCQSIRLNPDSSELELLSARLNEIMVNTLFSLQRDQP